MRKILAILFVAGFILGCESPEEHRRNMCTNFCYIDSCSQHRVKTLTYANHVTTCICTDDRQYVIDDDSPFVPEKKPQEEK